MWKRDEAVKPTAPAGPGPAPAQPRQRAASRRGDAGEAGERRRPSAWTGEDSVNIGKSVVIKGELNGSEDLTIEGQVEGKIELRQNVLTIGPNGKIKAQVFAKAVIVLGEVTGQRHGERQGRHPRQRLGRRRHRRAARGDCRRRAFPRQHRHAASGRQPTVRRPRRSPLQPRRRRRPRQQSTPATAGREPLAIASAHRAARCPRHLGGPACRPLHRA